MKGGGIGTGEMSGLEGGCEEEVVKWSNCLHVTCLLPYLSVCSRLFAFFWCYFTALHFKRSRSRVHFSARRAPTFSHVPSLEHVLVFYLYVDCNSLVKTLFFLNLHMNMQICLPLAGGGSIAS